MVRKQKKPIQLESIEKLLSGQTSVILSAVDERLQKSEKRVDERLQKSEKRVDERLQKSEERVAKLLNSQTLVILSAVDEKLQRSEDRVNQKIEKLVMAIDRFLKKTTDLEDEFEIMKFDINRLKKVVREKLGVKLA
jgi:hypothetical protein